MDFSFSEDQVMLRETVKRFVEKDYAFEKRRAIVKAGGYSAEVWKQFAELGLLALPMPEDAGGIGGGPVDVMVVMEELGRGIVMEPYAAVVVVAGGLLRDAGTPAQKEAWLPGIASGESKVVLAHTERNARYDLAYVETRARRSGSGWTVDGAKGVVPSGALADAFIVPARTSGGVGDAAGISLFLVPKGTAGVSVRGYPTQDGATAAELTLKGVALGADAMLGAEGAGLPLLERAVDQGIAALCAESIGAMERLLELTAEYLRTRKQFGVPIGSFQALQHRAVDMKVQLEMGRSMSYYATLMVDSPDAAERSRALSAAKVQIGQSLRYVGQQAIQLHGGIGVTDEYMASHYFKRLTMIELSLGDTYHHLGRFSGAMTLPA